MATTTTTTASVSKMEILAVIEAERRDILELYQSLAPSELQQVTLCTLWTVRDMLAHLITNDNPLPLWTWITSGFNGNTTNQKLIERLRSLTNEQLLGHWAHRLPLRGLATMMPDAYLADTWVHDQDIRWPLNRPREQDTARMRLVLAAILKLHKKRVAGLHLVANEIGWESGAPDQPLVTGDVEALAMGIANRPAARARLSGNGVEKLFT